MCSQILDFKFEVPILIVYFINFLDLPLMIPCFATSGNNTIFPLFGLGFGLGLGLELG